jgi:predicted phosphoadenosine phosphosulfate sulfurtransferase
MKRGLGCDVLSAAQQRIGYAFDHFEKVYVSFSGGKDSSVLFHLAADEARRRKRRLGVLVIDLEAQYELTIAHVNEMCDFYSDCIDLYWVCLPIKLRNAVSNYEPVWCAWDPGRKEDWVRHAPKRQGVITDPSFFDFFAEKMEFEEFVELFAAWYGGEASVAALIGIRSDESLNRWRTICRWEKETHFGKRWTTRVINNVYNCYPIYDWHVTDIWKYHAYFPEKPHNKVYDRMHAAGLSLSQMRLCQPYGDDQRRGLWLYHLLEPQTWGKVVARVNGANSGALYIEERGNVTGYSKITLPEGHTWRSFCNLLLATMPQVTRDHYLARFKGWLKGWHDRGYMEGIPDSAPPELEKKYWAPSWRRMCKVLLRNDWWCKGLGLTQPKSEAYAKYMQLKSTRKALKQ